MRLIVKESQYKSIIKEQQSKNKMVDQWSTFIMDKMLLNIPLSTEEIISETQLNRKIYRNNFYKKLPINNITINTIKGKDKNYDFEIELKDDIIENLFLDIQIPYNEEIKLEDIKSIFNSVTNKRFKLLDEQWIKGVDLGDLQGEVASTKGRFKVWFNKELKVIDINDGEIIFDKSNVDDDEWEKITQWAQEAFSEENYPEGGHVTDTDYNSITFDTTPDDVEIEKEDEKEESKEEEIDLTTLYSPRLTSKYGMRIHPIKRKKQMHWGNDYSVTQGSPLVILKKGIVRDAKIRNNACGGTLKIEMVDGNSIRFCHISNLKVNKGDQISAGQIVALTGGAKHSVGAGSSTGPHLHFEFKKDNKGNPIDPTNYAKTYWAIKK